MIKKTNIEDSEVSIPCATSALQDNTRTDKSSTSKYAINFHIDEASQTLITVVYNP